MNVDLSSLLCPFLILELHIGNRLFGSKVALLEVFVIPSWVLNAQKGIKAEGDRVFAKPRRCGGWLTMEDATPERKLFLLNR